MSAGRPRAAFEESPAEFKGHTNYVYAVAFSPDGATLATASYDNTVKLWDYKTGKEKNVLKGHASQVYSVAYSPDGNLIATGSMDKTIRLYDKEGKFIKVDRANPATYTKWTAPVGKTFLRTFVTLSPMNSRAYLLASDGTVYVINTGSMATVATIALGAPIASCSPPSSRTQRSHNSMTVDPECETNSKVAPCLRIASRRAKHLRWNSSSPTDRASSITMMSGSTLIATAKASLTTMPLE